MSEPQLSPILRTLAIDAQFGSASRVDSSVDSLFGDLLRRAEQTHREPQTSEDKPAGPKPSTNRDRKSNDGNESSRAPREAADSSQNSNATPAEKSNADSRAGDSSGSEESDQQTTDAAAADVVVVTPLATAVDAVNLSLIGNANGEQETEQVSANQLEAELASAGDANSELGGDAVPTEEQALGEIELDDSGESRSSERRSSVSVSENAGEVAAATVEGSRSTAEDGIEGEQQIVNDSNRGRLESAGSDADRDHARETRAENQSLDEQQAADATSRREASAREANRGDATSQPAEFSGGESSDDRPDSRPTHPVTHPSSAVTSGPSAFGPTIAAATTQTTEPIVDPARFVSRVARAFEVASQRGEPIQLRLHPPELGSVRLEMSVKDGVVTARFETETASARSALLDNLPALRERLSEQDMRIDRFDVDVRQETNEQPQQSDRDPNEAGNSRAEQRDGDLQTATEELSASQAGGSNDEDHGTQLNIVA